LNEAKALHYAPLSSARFVALEDADAHSETTDQVIFDQLLWVVNVSI
jgi:hypothetical protein